MVSQAFGSAEILIIADAVAREKNIPRDAVLEAMEQAIQIAGRRKYGHERNITAEISRKTGEVRLFRITDVVEEVEDENTQISQKDAKRLDAALNVGDQIRDPLPPIDFGRIAAQTAKQVIVQKVRDAERERQFNEFQDRANTIVSGVVKRTEYNGITVDLGASEGFIPRDQIIPREMFRTGDRVRAYVKDIRRERTGPQIFLSRTCPEFMAKLFAQEVPEIYDGLVEIKAVARDPGSRAKIAVLARDGGVNPVLSCVGVRGARVQAVVQELQGEKVDIIEYSEDPATFVVNAISSAEVSKVVIDEDEGKIEVVVPDDQLSLAIGRRGQNVRLACQLTGWGIDILTEETESERRLQEFNRLSDLFAEALNVEEVIANLLVTEGFTSVEEVGYVPVEELAAIEGFDEDVATELRQRARDWLESEASARAETFTRLGIQSDMQEVEGLEEKLMIVLAEKGVNSRDALAELDIEEFQEFVPESGLSEKQISDLIMRARAHWFADDAADEAKPEGDGEADEPQASNG